MPTTVPPSLYAHPDPLISRLRLNDSHGKPILDPAASTSELRDATVVTFLFGAQVDRENQEYGRNLYKGLIDLNRRSPHRFKCIYVSIDPNEESFSQSCNGKPWLSCTWHDGSNPEKNAINSLTAYEEEFIHDELDVKMAESEDALAFNHPEEKSTSSKSKGKKKASPAYKRPYSRVGLATKFDILTVPTLVVYHIPTATVLARSADPRELRSDNLDDTIAAWEAGNPSPVAQRKSLVGVREVLYRMRWTLALAVIALAFNLARVYGGDQFDISPLLMGIFTPGLAKQEMEAARLQNFAEAGPDGF